MQHFERNLYSAEQVGELDRRFIQGHGVPGFELMGRAAEAAFQHIRRQWPHIRSLVAFCGPGNNGGDGFLIAKLALEAGLQTTVYFLAKREKSEGDALRALQAYEEAGGNLSDFPAAMPDPILTGADVIVDAIFGTGLGRDIEGRFHNAITAINASQSGVFAVDIPSGLDANTGKTWGIAVKAQATNTFIGRKLGLYTGAGPACAGEVEFCSLDAPAAVYIEQPKLGLVLSADDVRQALQPRPRDTHKGSNGHLLCIGGNHGMGGAVRMAAEAALRTGAGLVSVATRSIHASAMSQARPELMCRGVDVAADMESLLDAASCIAIGPGLGQDDWARALFARTLDCKHTLVVDADGLNLLAAEPVARGNWILTPHPGEAARLLGLSTPQIQADRPAAVKELAKRYNAAVVLKGAGSLITVPNGELWLCDAGNPGMAVGGMGDVLTGVIAALLAQGLTTIDAARIGVYMHASAGDAASADGGQRGLLPTDLFPQLRRIANPR